MINKIEVNFIPKEAQRLECYKQSGCADYYIDDDYEAGKKLVINVSKSKNWRFQWLILLHEIVEIILVLHKGLSFKEIDRFDEQMIGHPDPGSHPAAPYHKEHMTALKIEKIICQKLGVKWGSY